LKLFELAATDGTFCSTLRTIFDSPGKHGGNAEKIMHLSISVPAASFSLSEERDLQVHKGGDTALWQNQCSFPTESASGARDKESGLIDGSHTLFPDFLSTPRPFFVPGSVFLEKISPVF